MASVNPIVNQSLNLINNALSYIGSGANIGSINTAVNGVSRGSDVVLNGVVAAGNSASLTAAIGQMFTVGSIALSKINLVGQSAVFASDVVKVANILKNGKTLSNSDIQSLASDINGLVSAGVLSAIAAAETAGAATVVVAGVTLALPEALALAAVAGGVAVVLSFASLTQSSNNSTSISQAVSSSYAVLSQASIDAFKNASDLFSKLYINDDSQVIATLPTVTVTATRGGNQIAISADGLTVTKIFTSADDDYVYTEIQTYTDRSRTKLVSEVTREADVNTGQITITTINYNPTGSECTFNEKIINTENPNLVINEVNGIESTNGVIQSMTVSGTGAVVNVNNASVTLADGASATINGSQLQLNVGANSAATVNGADLTIAGASGATVLANSTTRLTYDAFGNPFVSLNGAQSLINILGDSIGFAENTVNGGSIYGQISQLGLVTVQKTDGLGSVVFETGQASAMSTLQQLTVNAGDANGVAAYLSQRALDASQASGSGAISGSQLQRIQTLTSDPGEVSQDDLFASIYQAASVQYTQRAVLSEQFISKAAASLGISVQGAGALLANGATLIETLAAIKDVAQRPTIRSVANATYQALQLGVTFSAGFKVSLANTLLGDPVGSTAAQLAASQAQNLTQLDSLMNNLGTPLSVIAGIANPTPATVFTAANAVANQVGSGVPFPAATAIASAMGFIQNPSPQGMLNTTLWTIAAFQPEFIPMAIAVTAIETVVGFVFGGKPIVLDMTGKGINLTSVAQSNAYFDLNNDGKREHYGWIGTGNAFLVYDAKGDGNINSANNLSFVGASAGARTDLEGLVAFDTNHDNKIDRNDTGWRTLKVWQDSGDGISQATELKTLEQAGIASIALSADGVRRNIAGNTVFGQGTFTKTDGTKGTFADVALATDGQLAPTTVQVAQTASNAGSFHYFAPLVLNLVGGAVSTTPLSASQVTFDVQGNGSAIKTGWITPDEGFLVLDKNGNGKIDNGTEMIASFADLAKFDTANKGVIDASNSIYAQLKIWVDKSGEGVSKTAELYTLAQLGIASINVNAVATDNYSNGNIIHAIGSFTYTDGTKGQIADAWLAAGTASTGAVTTITSGATIVRMASGQTVEFVNGASNQTFNAGLDGVNVIVGGNNANTLAAGNAGSAVLIGGSGADTLIGGSGTATLHANGNGSRVIGGTGQATIQVNGNASTVTDVLGSASVVVNGNNNTVTVGVAGDSVSLGGSGNTLVTTGAATTAVNLVVTGTGATANVSSSQIIVGTNASLNLAGSNNAITVNGGATLTGTATGGTLTVNGQNNSAYVNWATVAVNAGGGINLTGHNGAISLTGGGSVSVSVSDGGYALSVSGQNNAATISNAAINIAANTSLVLNGYGNTFAETGGNVVTGNVTNSKIAVSGAGNFLSASRSVVTVADGAGLNFTGVGSTVSIGTNVQVLIEGTNNILRERSAAAIGRGAVVTVSGIGEQVFLQNGTLNVAANSQVSFTGSGETIMLGDKATLTVFGDNNITNVAANSQASFIGSGETIVVGDNVILTVLGDNNTIILGSNSSINVNGATNNLIVNGTGNTATLSGSHITMANGAGLSLIGHGDTIAGGSADVLSVVGGNHYISFTGVGNSLTLTGIKETVSMSSGSLTLVNGERGDDTSATLIGSNNRVIGGRKNTLIANGDNNQFTLGANDTLTASGSNLSATAVGNSNVVQIVGANAVIDGLGIGNTVNVTGANANVTISGSPITVVGANAIIRTGGSGHDFNISGGNATLYDSGKYNRLSLSGASNVVNMNNGSVTLADNSGVNLTGDVTNLNIGINDIVSVTGSGGSIGTRAVGSTSGWPKTVDTTSGKGSVINISGSVGTLSVMNSTVNLAENSRVATLAGARNVITLNSFSKIASSNGNGVNNRLIVKGYNEITLNSSSIEMVDNVSLRLNGNSNNVTGGSADVLAVTGNNNNFNFSGIDDLLEITGTNETVSMSSGRLILGNSTSVTLTGSNDTVIGGNKDVITANGNSNQFTVGANNTLNINGTGARVNASGVNNKVAMDNGSVILADNSGLNLVGSSNNVIMGINDTVSGVGNNDVITASMLTVGTTGQGDSLKLYGTGNQVSGVTSSQVSALTAAQANALISGMAGFVLPSAGAITVLASTQQASTVLVAAVV